MRLLQFGFVLLMLGFISAAPLDGNNDNARTLADDFEDFFDLLPAEELNNIVQEHLKTDGAFAYLVHYLQSAEFKELCEKIRSIPEAKYFKSYLEEAGLDVDGFREAAENSIDGLQPTAKDDSTASLRPLFYDAMKVLPLSKLLEFVNDKLETSKPAQDFFEEISSPKGRVLVEKVLKIPEMRRYIKRLRMMEINIDGIMTLVYYMMGWDKPPKVAPIPADKSIFRQL